MKFLFLRKQSLVYLILITFWAAYVTWSFSFSIHNIDKTTQKHFEFRKKRMDFAMDSAIPFLVKDNALSLVDYLKKANEQQLLDFYLLTKKVPKSESRQVIGFAAPQDNLEGINWNYEPGKNTPDKIEEAYEDNDVFYKTVQVEDYYFTVGIRKKLNDLVYEQALQVKNAFIQDMLVVTLMLSFIVFIFTKDILTLSKSLKQKDSVLKKGLASLSAEGQVLLAATRTFASNEKNLRNQNKQYSEVIAPALIEEIRLQTPPSSILQTTLVRIDLNGYTQLFLDRKETNITEILNAYFKRSREVIERYHGLVYQIIGDEIVFHIKDSKNYDSQIMSLFCLRHLFDVTQEIESLYLSDDQKKNSSFKIKASFIHGNLKFIKLDDGFALSGLPLIESVRMIGAFEEKKTNSITCTKQVADKYFNVFEIEHTTEKQFKGFDSKVEICLIKNFRSENQILNCFDKAQFARYARKDADIIRSLHHLENYIRQSDLAHFYGVVNEMKNYKLMSASTALITAYADLIEYALDEFEINPMKKDYLSALVSLSYNLVPTQMYNSDIKRLFSQCLKIGDPRTQANVVTALEEFDPKSEIYKDYYDSESNRLAANALLVDARKGLDKKVKAKIVNFVKSENLFFVASGLWVIEQSAFHHKQNDPVYFSSNSYFEELFELAKKFTNHENEMVRKRAVAVATCFETTTDNNSSSQKAIKAAA